MYVLCSAKTSLNIFKYGHLSPHLYPGFLFYYVKLFLLKRFFFFLFVSTIVDRLQAVVRSMQEIYSENLVKADLNMNAQG